MTMTPTLTFTRTIAAPIVTLSSAATPPVLTLTPLPR